MTPPRPDSTPACSAQTECAIEALYADLWARLPQGCARLEADLTARLGPGWTAWVDPAERRHPVVEVAGPPDDDARRLIVHLTPVRCRASTFHATVGVSMREGDLDLAAGSAPGWIPRIRTLGEAAEEFAAARCAEGRPGLLRVSQRPGGGTLGPAAAKLAIADRHGLPRRWAKGWPDRFLGLRTEPVAGEDVPEFLAEVGELLTVVVAGPVRAA